MVGEHASQTPANKYEQRLFCPIEALLFIHFLKFSAGWSLFGLSHSSPFLIGAAILPCFSAGTQYLLSTKASASEQSTAE